MEKNDIFNTNLLQLPMKAQVADEGAVQDTALAAEPTAPAMREGSVLDVLAQDGGVLRRPFRELHERQVHPRFHCEVGHRYDGG